MSDPAASTTPCKRPNGPSESSPKRSATKRRKKMDPETVLSSAGVDVLSIVIQFLGLEIFRVAFTSKTLLNMVTTKMVVRSALLSGGHAATSIKELDPLMSISPPSPVRLLRLVNGKVCEKCGPVPAWPTEFKDPSEVNHVRPSYGVFLCWSCIKERGYTTKLKTTWVPFRRNPHYHAIVDHKRVVAGLYGDVYYVWKRLLQQGTEKCGPLGTFNMMEATAAAQTPIECMFDHAPPESDYQEFVTEYEICNEEAKSRTEARERPRSKHRWPLFTSVWPGYATLLPRSKIMSTTNGKVMC